MAIATIAMSEHLETQNILQMQSWEKTHWRHLNICELISVMFRQFEAAKLKPKQTKDQGTLIERVGTWKWNAVYSVIDTLSVCLAGWSKGVGSGGVGASKPGILFIKLVLTEWEMGHLIGWLARLHLLPPMPLSSSSDVSKKKKNVRSG